MLNIHKFRAISDFLVFKEAVLPRRFSVEKLIGEEHRSDEGWRLIGFCKICARASRFLVDWQYSDEAIPNFRERLVCEHCGLNNRQRFVAAYLQEYMKSDSSISSIYMYEQVTNFYSYLSRRLRDVSVTGSEYLGYDRKGGVVIDGVRHEDALSLSFSNQYFDVIISNDVFEHVPHIQRALSEAHRVLKPGGKLIFTIPFYSDREKTEQRAIMNNGRVDSLMPNKYHGNPVCKQGSLVFYDFGWDILETCKEGGFDDAYALSYYSLFYGHIGGLQLVFVAEK